MSARTTARPGPLLFSLVLAASVVLLGTTILNVALPELAQSLHASDTDQQWILNSYTLTFAGFMLLSGVVGDRFGHRRVLIAALGLFAVAAAAGSAAPGVGLLIAMRALMGIAAAGIMPITLAVINRTVPGPRRPAAITVWAAFSGLSIALGPLLGGALLNAGLWWGSVLALVALLAVGRLTPTAGRPGPRPGGPGCPPPPAGRG
jgi:MFS family permease